MFMKNISTDCYSCLLRSEIGCFPVVNIYFTTYEWLKMKFKRFFFLSFINSVLYLREKNVKLCFTCKMLKMDRFEEITREEKAISKVNDARRVHVDQFYLHQSDDLGFLNKEKHFVFCPWHVKWMENKRTHIFSVKISQSSLRKVDYAWKSLL